MVFFRVPKSTKVILIPDFQLEINILCRKSIVLTIKYQINYRNIKMEKNLFKWKNNFIIMTLIYTVY